MPLGVPRLPWSSCGAGETWTKRLRVKRKTPGLLVSERWLGAKRPGEESRSCNGLSLGSAPEYPDVSESGNRLQSGCPLRATRHP